MKKTQTIFVTAFLMLFIFAVTIYTSCKKDACKGVTCLNGGTCKDGKCTCPSGYSGVYCGTSVNAQYSGTWSGTDCSGDTYNAVITSSPTNPYIITVAAAAKEIVFCGFISAPIENFICTINSNDTTAFDIAPINIDDNCGNIWIVGGKGTLRGNVLAINWDYASGSVILPTCTYSATK
jgi:EGF-like domain